VHDRTSPCTGVFSGGYYILRGEQQDYLIFDAGRPCPDYLPAHAHADLLSFELTVNGDRVLVDSGVYEYAPGPWRDFFRSTRAHNTVEVDGENQSDVWASFRVARRAHVESSSFTPTEQDFAIRASHDGYAHGRPSTSHRRLIWYKKDRFWLVLDDLGGVGQIAARSFLHAHPNYHFSQIDESLWHLSKRGCADVWVALFGQASSGVTTGQKEPEIQGWYSERFGEIVPNEVLVLRRRAPLPFSFGYVISKERPLELKINAQSNLRWILQVRVGNETYQVDAERDALTSE
jgi:uncharacterized heparinase superfamily protein